MKITFEYNGKTGWVDLNTGIDLAIPLRDGVENPNCFWAPLPSMEPVRAGDFVGSTAEGGVVNFFNVRINPHGNGTHTECVGHISREPYILHRCLKNAHHVAKLISLYPTRLDDGDRVVTLQQIEGILQPGQYTALIIRTLPNDDLKMRTNYSGANPPYLHHDAVAWMVACGIEHLLIDLPSVDREEDGGLLLGHKAFWRYPGPDVRAQCTITEMIYAPGDVPDGDYWLNLQITRLELDASPSRPVAYPIEWR